MKIELLNTVEQFKQIEKGDLILVKWSESCVKHIPGTKEIMLYKVHENKGSHNEIIYQKKNNHYFNYGMYLEGQSCALEVYKITDN